MKMHSRKKQAGFTLLEYIVALVVASIIAAMVYTFFGSALTQSGVPITRLQQVSKFNRVMESIVADYERLNKIDLRFKWRSGRKYSAGDIVLPSTLPNDNVHSTIHNNGRYYICTQAGTSGTGMTTTSWPVTPSPNPLVGTVTNDGTVHWAEAGYVWKENTPYPANAIVVPKRNNGHFYKGPSADFMSGTNEPGVDPNPPWPTAPGGTVSDGAVTWTEAGTILDRTGTDNIVSYLTNDPGRYDNYSNSYDVVETKFIQFDSSTRAEVNAGTSGTSGEKNVLKVTIKNKHTAETLTKLFMIR